MSEGDVITQAPEGSDVDFVSVVQLPQTISLNLNGTLFRIPRERLLSLPQNILFDLSTGMAQPSETGDENDSVICVDFSPECFAHVLSTLEASDRDLEPVPLADFKVSTADMTREFLKYDESSDEEEWDNDSIENAPWVQALPSGIPEVLLKRPAYIMLREDLDYYVLSDPKASWDAVAALKNAVGDELVAGGNNAQVFNNLRNKDVFDSPEYHLMQMLVLAGVSPEETWGVRERKPSNSKIISIKLSRIRVPDELMSDAAVQALHKVVLFWRKPAKKCWWGQFQHENVKIHARRVWTLELCITGLAG